MISIAMACWIIWKERRALVFQKKAHDLRLCIRKINEAVAELVLISLQDTDSLKQKRQGEYLGWTRPTFGLAKMNCDGAFNKPKNNGIGSIAGTWVVIKDEEGSLLGLIKGYV